MNDINNNKPALIVMVGLPASGKSTARQTSAATGASAKSYHYSTDDKIEVMAARQGVTYSEAFESAIKEATAKSNLELAEAIENRQGVIWDQTNLNARKRRKILNQFPSEVYRRECICILPPMNHVQESELQRRLHTRPGKSIPNTVIQSMRASFQLPTVEEGFDRVMFFDIFGNWINPKQASDFFVKD